LKSQPLKNAISQPVGWRNLQSALEQKELIMANICDNQLRLEGNKAAIDKIWKEILQDDHTVNFYNKGFGTLYGEIADNTIDEAITKGINMLYFESKWQAPEDGFLALSRKYPDIIVCDIFQECQSFLTGYVIYSGGVKYSGESWEFDSADAGNPDDDGFDPDVYEDFLEKERDAAWEKLQTELEKCKTGNIPIPAEKMPMAKSESVKPIFDLEDFKIIHKGIIDNENSWKKVIKNDCIVKNDFGVIFDLKYDDYSNFYYSPYDEHKQLAINPSVSDDNEYTLRASADNKFLTVIFYYRDRNIPFYKL
jgi:hypothetical protein